MNALASHEGECLSISHITFYVSNAKQTAINFCLMFGFSPYRYRGLEFGDRFTASHAIRSNDIILVFVSPLIHCSENQHIIEHISTHGDAVKDVGEYYLVSHRATK